jgi:DNA-directed RNA polymerase subunit RPC12/RpoP
MVIDTQKFAKIIESIRGILKKSYLLSYTNSTHVLLFQSSKHDEVKDLLSKLADRYEGCCFYFKDFSVALWQDVEDAIGFQGDPVCCVEFFENEINRNFHWRKKPPAVQKGNNMQIPIRIECPHCHWGHSFSSSYINQGYLKGKCDHCGEAIFFKVIITGFNIEINKELPAGVPCRTLPEAKEGDLKIQEILNEV